MMEKLGLICLLLVSAPSFAMILPPNSLHQEDNINRSEGITEEQFNTLTDQAVDFFKPLAKVHGAKLSATKAWSDSTVNAYADQKGDDWVVSFFGGLARRKEMTPDAYTQVVCHELGHHFGGYYFDSFYKGMAAEGQADYFSSQVCTRTLWKKDLEANHRAAATVPKAAKSQCDAVWSETADRELCYRIADSSLALATLLAAVGNDASPSFETPDKKEVSSTNDSHPAAQCRLDTYFKASLCQAKWDLNKIPGKDDRTGGENTKESEIEAAKYSCMASSGHSEGLRPRCWFKSLVD